MIELLVHPLWGWVVWASVAFVVLFVGDRYSERAIRREERQERDHLRALHRAAAWQQVRDLDEAA